MQNDEYSQVAVYVSAFDASLQEKGTALAKHIGIEYRGENREPSEGEICLRVSEDGVCLYGDGKMVMGDFSAMLPRIKTANLRSEMLVRAAMIKDLPEKPTAFDATAGLGEDSFLLAAAGYSVTMFEFDKVIAALLGDALERAAKIPQLAEIVSRMTLVEGNSIEKMTEMNSNPDLIYLDPMFPERRKSGKVKKKFQLIHGIELPCEIETELLNAAISLKPRRIVVKRPLKGELLGGIKPNFSISGKAIRYDCLTPKRD